MSERLHRPVFIIAPPRSGSTLLFNLLSAAPQAWTIRAESHLLFEGIKGLHPRDRGWDSNRLDERDATPEVTAQLTRHWLGYVSNRDDQLPQPGDVPILLEKTPKNFLRVPFLATAFPDARFIHLYREPAEVISSLLEGWRVPPPKFKTYPDLPDWPGPPWSFLLVPGWRDLAGLDLPSVAALQWAKAASIAVSDFRQLRPGRWTNVRFDELLAEPEREIKRLCDFLDWTYDRPLTSPLPLSGSQISAPEPDKWRKHATELEPALALVADVVATVQREFT